MPETHVYGILLQAYHADKSAARLLHALAELAGRLEVLMMFELIWCSSIYMGLWAPRSA
jgi:hypothetical protein